MLEIRDEQPADEEAVREVSRLAFGCEDEALLGAQIVGHILFQQSSDRNGTRGVTWGGACAPGRVTGLLLRNSRGLFEGNELKAH